MSDYLTQEYAAKFGVNLADEVREALLEGWDLQTVIRCFEHWSPSGKFNSPFAAVVHEALMLGTEMIVDWHCDVTNEATGLLPSERDDVFGILYCSSESGSFEAWPIRDGEQYTEAKGAIEAMIERDRKVNAAIEADEEHLDYLAV